jgi:probable biosynthetic protein (TIGR04099 family)
MKSGTAQREPASATDRLHFPAMLPVRTGMPELCRAGLSETWLLKACGHRHWLALAQAHGFEKPEFRDIHGSPLYPAFTQVQLDQARLEDVRAGDDLAFAVTLARLSRTRFRSDIAVTVDGAPIASLTMDTAFVRRCVERSNQSIRRAIVAAPCQLIPPGGRQWTPVEKHWPEGPGLAELVLDPSPYEDFNGVGLLYFAAFQALIDRAEWHWFRDAERIRATAARTISFHGNAELGDRIRAVLRAGDCDRHQIELSRCSDGKIIARAETIRRTLEEGVPRGY